MKLQRAVGKQIGVVRRGRKVPQERYMSEARAVEPGAAKIEVTSGLRLSEESHAIEAAFAG